MQQIDNEKAVYLHFINLENLHTMASKIYLAFVCTVLFICSCNKAEPELNFPYNFECKIDGRNYSVDYDREFVEYFGLRTTHDKSSKKLVIDSYDFAGDYFYIEVDGFEKEGFITNSAISAKLRNVEFLGLSKYDYEIDYFRPAYFHIIEFDCIRNTAKGTFAFSLKPINLQSNLHPIDITEGKFRFEFD